MLQAWMERRLRPSRQNNASKTVWNTVQRHQQTKQFLGLDGMQAPTASADKAMLQAWMECRLQRHQQTKQCISHGLDTDSNAISRQSNSSGLDRIQASKSSADKEMLQVWMNGDSITST
jgi:hypothetical protein